MRRFYRKLLKRLLNVLLVVAVLAFIFVGILTVLSYSVDDFDLEGLLAVRSVDELQEWYSGEVTNAVVGQPVVVESVSYDRYAYQQLDDETKAVYDQVYDCITTFSDKITLSTKESSVLEKAYEAVMADYGNLFWVKGYQYNTYTSGDTVVGLEFAPKYTMDEEQRDIYQLAIDAKVEEWLAGVNESDSDFDKALCVFETLIENVDYDENSEENQNILSVFLYQSTVCQGYADATWYLLEQLGIKSTIITGTANGESHAWNLVYLDNAYYFMDVTWGNSKYLNLDNSTEKRVNYAYFAMTSEELSQTHTITSSFAVPECLSTADNYYVHYGLYFSEFDADAIGNLMSQSLENGDSELSIKFGNSELYNKVVEYFFDEKHISDYCSSLESIYYLMDENANVLTIQW